MTIKRFHEKTVMIFIWMSSIFLLISVLSIIGFLFLKGYKTIGIDLIFRDTSPLDAIFLRRHVIGGLFPALAGTALLVVISTGIAIPFGLATGIYLSEYARPSMKRFLNIFLDILAGIPSIVIGLFGLSLAIFLHRYVSGRIYPCLLISALSLAVLVLPYIVRSTQVCLEGLPLNVRLTGTAMGASRFQNLIHVLLPQSLSGILGGIILAIGRCAEDTAVIMLTGAVATAGIPSSLLAPFEAIPFYIFYISSEFRNQEELMTGYGASIILLILCLFLFGASYVLKARLQKKFTGYI